MKWADSPNDIRKQALLLSGRDTSGKPAIGHRHVSFFLWGAEHSPTRLCAWRVEPFTDAEQRAILDAASTPLPLNYRADPWTLTLVPLDPLVLPPTGFAGESHREWKSLTPYVPPRHVFGRSGKEKPGCSVQDQIRNELANRGVEVAGLAIAIERSGWVKTHRSKAAQRERTNNNKLGHIIRLRFQDPVEGPVFLGTSCHFGLGLFVPVAE